MLRSAIFKQNHLGMLTYLCMTEKFLERYGAFDPRDESDMYRWEETLKADDFAVREWAFSTVSFLYEKRSRPRAKVSALSIFPFRQKETTRPYELLWIVERLLIARDWRAREIARNEL